jgi:hypothetical protein
MQIRRRRRQKGLIHLYGSTALRHGTCPEYWPRACRPGRKSPLLSHARCWFFFGLRRGAQRGTFLLVSALNNSSHGDSPRIREIRRLPSQSRTLSRRVFLDRVGDRWLRNHICKAGFWTRTRCTATMGDDNRLAQAALWPWARPGVAWKNSPAVAITSWLACSTA